MGVVIVDLLPLIIREAFGHPHWGERELALSVAHKVVSYGNNVVVALDSRSSDRKDADGEYKKKRKLPPDVSEKLSKAIPMVIKLLKNAGVKIYQAEGYEADDVIATLCKNVYKDCDKVIISPDKDLYSLLDKSTIIFTGKRFITEDELLKKFGVSPEQWVDVLSLAGDRTDEVKGVRGIGIKTATKLVAKYGHRVREALTEDQKEQYDRAKQMVELRIVEDLKEL